MSKAINEKYRKRIKEIKSQLHVGDEYSPPSADSWVESKPVKKQPVIAMKLHCGAVKFYNQEIPLSLPKGCTGIMFVFESKKTAREYWGKDVPLLEVEEIDETK